MLIFGDMFPEQNKFFLKDKKNIKIFIYEDLLKNPEAFIKEVYRYLNVNDDFVPQALHYKVATTREVGVDLWKGFI